ncbi:hypothetical protein [Terrabacter sp. C0L_2]|uniref:hypothetical protein n=1 Tax=Terrabacter sp. C0L_2 TaxID=3108389 RepID=UPI002ED25D0F|nr:hypothetical protein U5C87_01880 [Terrabacter sp. C0L_2]
MSRHPTTATGHKVTSRGPTERTTETADSTGAGGAPVATTYREALREAHREALRADPRV